MLTIQRGQGVHGEGRSFWMPTEISMVVGLAFFAITYLEHY